jgi:hypothetical protein
MHELLAVVPVLGNLTQGDIFEDHPEDDSLLEGVTRDMLRRGSSVLRVDDEIEGSRNDVLDQAIVVKEVGCGYPIVDH